MHSVIRTYTGAPGAAAQLKPHAKEIETLLRRAKGFIAYYLLDTPDGMISITVCQDRAGCDESTQLAAQWVRENKPNLFKSPPQITQGDLALRFYSEEHART